MKGTEFVLYCVLASGVWWSSWREGGGQDTKTAGNYAMLETLWCWGHLLAIDGAAVNAEARLERENCLAVGIVCVSACILGNVAILHFFWGDKLPWLYSPYRSLWELQLDESQNQNSLLSFQLPQIPTGEGKGSASLPLTDSVSPSRQSNLNMI